MNKLLASIVACGITVSAFALPVGNPIDASILNNSIFWKERAYEGCFSFCNSLSVDVGFYGDYVSDRRMRTDASGYPDSSIRKTSITTNAGYIAVNMWDCFGIFATLGASGFRVDAQQSNFEVITVGTDNALTFDTETDFSWSIGARTTIWNWCGFSFGAEFQYFQSCPSLNHLIIYNEPTLYLDGIDFEYREWQLGLGVTYPMCIGNSGIGVAPYAAIKGGRAWVEMDNAFVDNRRVMHDLDTQQGVGYALGMTLMGCNFCSATVEGRFADELAFHVKVAFAL